MSVSKEIKLLYLLQGKFFEMGYREVFGFSLI